VQALGHIVKRQSCRFTGLAEALATAGCRLESVHGLVVSHSASTLGIEVRILRKFLSNPLLVALSCSLITQSRLYLRRQL